MNKGRVSTPSKTAVGAVSSARKYQYVLLVRVISVIGTRPERDGVEERKPSWLLAMI